VIRAALIAALACAPLWPQTVAVYSEFRRVDPFGRILEPDSAGHPREILSPGVARNAFASFRVVVTVPPGKSFALHLAENPDNIVQASLYKETLRLDGTRYVPGRLTPLKLPYEGTIPEANDTIPRRRASTFWLDLWVRAGAPVKRVRVEVQLNVGDQWVIYPMELRVLEAVVPAAPAPTATLEPVASAADATAWTTLRANLCGTAKPQGKAEAAATVRQRILRNAMQDVALARALEKSIGREALLSALATARGLVGAYSFCSPPADAPPPAPESYLRARDFLHRSASK